MATRTIGSGLFDPTDFTKKRGDVFAYGSNADGKIVSPIVTNTNIGGRFANSLGVQQKLPSQIPAFRSGSAPNVDTASYTPNRSIPNAPRPVFKTEFGAVPVSLRDKAMLEGQAVGSPQERRAAMERVNKIIAPIAAQRAEQKKQAEIAQAHKLRMEVTTAPTIQAGRNAMEQQAERFRLENEQMANKFGLEGEAALAKFGQETELILQRAQVAEDRAIKEGKDINTPEWHAAQQAEIDADIDKTKTEGNTERLAALYAHKLSLDEKQYAEEINRARGVFDEKTGRYVPGMGEKPVPNAANRNIPAPPVEQTAQPQGEDLNRDGTVSADETEFNQIARVLKANPDMPEADKIRIKNRQTELRNILGL